MLHQFQETLDRNNVQVLAGQANSLGLKFAELEKTVAPMLPENSDDEDNDKTSNRVLESAPKKRRLRIKTGGPQRV